MCPFLLHYTLPPGLFSPASEKCRQTWPTLSPRQYRELVFHSTRLFTRSGASPETIKGSFPTLTLEQVYGAIAFYLSRQPEIDEYLRKSEEEYEADRQANHDQLRREKPELWERLMRAKDERRTTRR